MGFRMAETKVYCEKVDLDTWKAFKQAVIGKYGKLRGVLGKELTEALKLYLNHYSPNKAVTHTQIVENDIRISRNNGDRILSKSMRTAQAIAQRILEEYTEEITEPIVEQYIMEVAGGHPQTIKKYKSILKAYGFLKPLRMMYNSDKMIFKVNPNADLLR